MCVYDKKYNFTYLIAHFKGEILKGIPLFFGQHVEGCVCGYGAIKGGNTVPMFQGELKTVVILLAVLAPWPKEASNARLFRQPQMLRNCLPLILGVTLGPSAKAQL